MHTVAHLCLFVLRLHLTIAHRLKDISHAHMHAYTSILGHTIITRDQPHTAQCNTHSSQLLASSSACFCCVVEAGNVTKLTRILEIPRRSPLWAEYIPAHLLHCCNKTGNL